jgi:hypothetical protein
MQQHAKEATDGPRVNGIQEVVGSIPTSSTTYVRGKQIICGSGFSFDPD